MVQWCYCIVCVMIQYLNSMDARDSLHAGSRHMASSALISVMVVLPYSLLLSLMVGRGDRHLASVSRS